MFADGMSELHSVSSASFGNTNSPENVNAPSGKSPRYGEGVEHSHQKKRNPVLRNTMDLKNWLEALGLSFVDETPVELAYLLVSDIRLRLNRFNGQQLVVYEVQDVQRDNQLPQAACPDASWSSFHAGPPPS